MAAADVSRRINAERIALVGWMRALLLQLAHPLIAAGVAEHSTFRGSTLAAFRRLHHTIGAMLTLTFGTPGAREQVLDGIRAIHRGVHGTLTTPCGRFPAGTRYSAEDSALLVWVHATLVESIVLTYESLVHPLAAAERDQFCADSAQVAIELGAHSDAVPKSWATLRAYMDQQYAEGHIAVGDTARTVATRLITPLPGWIGRRVVSPVMSLLAAGLLPPAIRRQYGFAWNRRRAARFSRGMRVLRLIRRGSPDRVALWKRGRYRACYPARYGDSATAR